LFAIWISFHIKVLKEEVQRVKLSLLARSTSKYQWARPREGIGISLWIFYISFLLQTVNTILSRLAEL